MSVRQQDANVESQPEKHAAGRKPKDESRADEFRARLVAWQETPADLVRPSLRALASELGTSHQLLKFYLDGLDEWRTEKDLESFRANAKAKNVPVTPEDERRYLAWLKGIRARQVSDRAKYGPRLRRVLKKIEELGGVEAMFKRIEERGPHRWPAS